MHGLVIMSLRVHSSDFGNAGTSQEGNQWAYMFPSTTGSQSPNSAHVQPCSPDAPTPVTVQVLKGPLKTVPLRATTVTLPLSMAGMGDPIPMPPPLPLLQAPNAMQILHTWQHSRWLWQMYCCDGEALLLRSWQQGMPVAVDVVPTRHCSCGPYCRCVESPRRCSPSLHFQHPSLDEPCSNTTSTHFAARLPRLAGMSAAMLWAMRRQLSAMPASELGPDTAKQAASKATAWSTGALSWLSHM